MKGDEKMDAFEILYEKYKKDIYYYLLSIVKNPTIAEDLLSETFLKAYISIGTLKKEEAFRSWLFSIAHRQYLLYLRKEKNNIPYEEYMKLQEKEEDERNKNRIALFQHFLSLKDKNTQTLVQMRLEGYPYTAIAEKLNISENSCRVMDYRIKHWLKQQIEKEEKLYE